MSYVGVVAIVTKEEKINFIFFSQNDGDDQDSDKEPKIIETDLKDYLKQFPDLSKTFYGNMYTLHNLPGVGNFLLSVTSNNSKKCFYFHVGLKTNFDDLLASKKLKELEIKVEIKSIASFDLNYEHIGKMEFCPTTEPGSGKTGNFSWYMIRYLVYDNSNIHLFQFILLNEEGKVVDEHSFDYNSTISNRDACIFFTQKLEQKSSGQSDKLGRHSHSNQLSRHSHVHVCYRYDSIERKVCDCKHLATKICIPYHSTIVTDDGEGINQCKVLDVKTGKEEFSLTHPNAHVFYHDRKLYFSMKNNRPGCSDSQLFTEVTFSVPPPFDDEASETPVSEVRKREIIVPTRFHYTSDVSHNDYLLLRPDKYFNNDASAKDFKFYLLNFFSKTFKVLDGKYFGNGSSTYRNRIIINTSIYDFYFLKIVSENLNNNIPQDLIDIINTF
jgi:hypothetical protein